MENRKPEKVSIIVPVYNGESNVGQTLNRILASSYRELEVIIVNDGSTDRSRQLCERISEEDERVLLYNQTNGGVVSARNYGVERATGDFLCFCDQDDLVEPEMYERMAACMQRDNSDICMCSTGRSINGEKSDFEKSADACYRKEEVLEQVLYPVIFNGYDVPVKKGNIRRYPHIWNCMFRKSFWDNNQFQFRRYVNYEDDLLMKIDTLSRAECVSTISYVGYYWNVNLKSETYRQQFIENLVPKQQLCYEDMANCIDTRVNDEEVLKLFKQVTFCKQYLEAVHIGAGAGRKERKISIREFVETTIYNREFEECIAARKYISKGQVRAKVLLPLLSKKWTIMSCCMEKMLNQIMQITLRFQALTMLERRMKE